MHTAAKAFCKHIHARSYAVECTNSIIEMGTEHDFCHVFAMTESFLLADAVDLCGLAFHILYQTGICLDCLRRSFWHEEDDALVRYM